MSYKQHGQSLTALPALQPGSSFDITESGFDTGTRKFVCDKSALPDILPARGTADTSIRFTIGGGVTREGNYRGMYVNSVGNITEGRNDLVEYTVNYLGLVKANKPVFLRQGTSTSVVSDTFHVKKRDGTTVDVTEQQPESLPTATRIYVQNSQPSLAGYGRLSIPPELVNLATEILGGPFGSSDFVYAGWMLSNRETKVCGPQYEVTDTYNWINVRES